jgi:DNA-binding protein HU-alpha
METMMGSAMSAKDLIAERKPATPAVKKPGAGRANAGKPAKEAVTDTSDLVDSDTEYKADIIKIKDMLTAVVQKTGAKKKDAKDVVDAFLGEMAKAMGAGKSLALPPLGNIRVVKSQDKGNLSMLVLKLRMGSAGDAKDTLAQDDEDR